MGWFSKKPSEFDTMMQLLKSVPLDKWSLEQTSTGLIVVCWERVMVHQDAGPYLNGKRDPLDEAFILDRTVTLPLTQKQRSVVFQWLKETVMRMTSLALLEQLRKDESRPLLFNKTLGTIKT